MMSPFKIIAFLSVLAVLISSCIRDADTERGRAAERRREAEIEREAAQEILRQRVQLPPYEELAADFPELQTGDQNSEQDVLLLNEDYISSLKAAYDLVRTDSIVTQTSKSVEALYRSGDTTLLFKYDNQGNMLMLLTYVRELLYSREEFFKNGQVKSTYSPHSEYDGVEAVTYYYENGRIESIGMYIHNKPVGVWKNYDTDGTLMTINHHDRNGKVIRTEYAE